MQKEGEKPRHILAHKKSHETVRADKAFQTAAEMRADGLTKRGISRKMGTYVRITAPGCERNEDGEKRRRGFEEEKMAFSCVLHLKEECDGCGMCEEPLGRAEAWSAETER